MCQVLNVSRSTYYYESKPKKNESQLVTDIVEVFRRSRNNYGTRKIKHELDKIENIVDRNFNEQPYLNVVVSDLKYVRVKNCWHYLCVLVDLFNREIIGYSSGPNKDAELVKKAFSTVQTNLSQIKIFHTDRGNEFKNKIIDEILEVFDIERSLSMKGCPYDNAVAEATYKVIKTEFVNHQVFETQEQLGYEFADYVNWYNNHRIHSSLEYLYPVEYRENTLKKVV